MLGSRNKRSIRKRGRRKKKKENREKSLSNHRGRAGAPRNVRDVRRPQVDTYICVDQGVGEILKDNACGLRGRWSEKDGRHVYNNVEEC